MMPVHGKPEIMLNPLGMRGKINMQITKILEFGCDFLL
jgi:hypothetical protein